MLVSVPDAQKYKKTFLAIKISRFYSARVRIYTYLHRYKKKKGRFRRPRNGFQRRRSIASTITATAPSPVTLVAVPKLSMAI